MGNTHLTGQGTASYAEHAVGAKVGMEGAWKGQAETLPGALPKVSKEDELFEKGNQRWLRASPALQMGEQVLCVHAREVQVYPAPATHFPEDDQSPGQWAPALAGRNKCST